MTERMSLEQFSNLGRDEMVQALRVVDPALVKGKTRAKKEELIAIYRSLPVGPLKPVAEDVAYVLKKEGEEPKVFTDVDVAISALKAEGNGMVVVGHADPSVELRALARKNLETALIASEPTPHVHGPGCGHQHEFPTLMGMEGLERVNPSMPMMPFQDGAVIEIPKAVDPDYVLRSTGEPGPLNDKQKRIVDRFVANYNLFCENPQNSTARREAKTAIYDLKTAGVILHQKFESELAKGAASVREARRQWAKGGDSVAALIKPTTKPAEAASEKSA